MHRLGTDLQFRQQVGGGLNAFIGSYIIDPRTNPRCQSRLAGCSRRQVTFCTTFDKTRGSSDKKPILVDSSPGSKDYVKTRHQVLHPVPLLSGLLSLLLSLPAPITLDALYDSDLIAALGSRWETRTLLFFGFVFTAIEDFGPSDERKSILE